MSDEQGSAPAGNPTAPAAAPAWYAPEGLDPTTTGQLGELVKAKGWKGPADALLSYQNLEKVFGADKAGRTILAPKSDDDADGWSAVYNRLGRPESADKYELPVPEGDDGSFAQAAAPVLHELGLTTKQAKGLAEWWNQASSTRIEAADEAFSKQSEAEYSALKGEWGAAAAQNEELAKRAVLKFGKEAGIDEATFDSLERAIGTAKVMKLFHAIGAKFGEADFVGSDTPSSGALTPAQAKNKVASLFADQEFMGRYMHQDQRVRQSAIEEMMALNRMANPGVTEE
jgi:hypothetical protein